MQKRDIAGCTISLRLKPMAPTNESVKPKIEHMQQDLEPAPSSLQLAIFKGGSAFNPFLSALQKKGAMSYILPLSDDGGSSREIIRCFGGPSIGDIRSTLTRLFSTEERHLAVKFLFELRLNKECNLLAKEEWQMLLKGSHPLFSAISTPLQELIYPFLYSFEQRCAPLFHAFDLRNGSIGNFFLTAARLQLGSLEQALYLFSKLGHISPNTQVLPAIATQKTLQIAAKLQDQSLLVGQSLISHPSASSIVDKGGSPPLSTAIEKVFYVDSLQKPMTYAANSHAIAALKKAKGIVYAIGSFWTSIIPSLILKGMGEAIGSSQTPKIGLLNSFRDREMTGMLTAVDYVKKLTAALNRQGELSYAPSHYLTHLLAVQGSEFALEQSALAQMGIELILIPPAHDLQLTYQQRLYPAYHVDRCIAAIEHILFNFNFPPFANAK